MRVAQRLPVVFSYAQSLLISKGSKLTVILINTDDLEKIIILLLLLSRVLKIAQLFRLTAALFHHNILV